MSLCSVRDGFLKLGGKGDGRRRVEGMYE